MMMICKDKEAKAAQKDYQISSKSKKVKNMMIRILKN